MRIDSELMDDRIGKAAFEHVGLLNATRDHLTSAELAGGFLFGGERMPLVNPQRGIFKPRQMRHLLSIRTVFPKPGSRIWYDDQRHVHRQLYESNDFVDYGKVRSAPEVSDGKMNFAPYSCGNAIACSSTIRIWQNPRCRRGRCARRFLSIHRGIWMNFMHSVALSTLFIGCAASAQAANLIVNGGFDTDASSWTADPAGTSFWRDATQDANGSSSSGALAMSTSNGINANLSVSQCVGSLAGGSDYSFGAMIKPNTAAAYGMTCTAFASTDCSGTALGSADAVQGTTGANNWIAFHSSTPFTLPPTTQSVSCAVTASQPLRVQGAQQPNGNYVNAIWADDVFLAPGTTPVSLQSFDVD